MAKEKKIKLILFRIGMALLPLLLVLVLVEIFLRVIDYNPLKHINEKSVREHIFLKQSSDKYIRYELNPGYKGTIVRAEIRINSHGFRGREYDIEKKNKFRICVLGDSLAFGTILKEEDLFPQKVEKYFLEDSIPIEALNLAVLGYDTLQEVKNFEQKGLKFSPDLVIVAYCLNDIGITPLEYKKIKKFVAMKRSLRIVQFIRLKLDRLRLINKLKKEMDSIKGYDHQFRELYRPVENDPVIDRYVEEIRQTLDEYENPFWLRHYTSPTRIGKIRYSFEELKRMSVENKFEVIVVIFPLLKKFHQQYVYARAHDIIRHEAERNGFKVLDLTEPFDHYGFKKLTYDGVHLNAAGHKLASQVLYKELKPMIPPNPPPDF
jgi:lysophospholipase L1-like esterase